MTPRTARCRPGTPIITMGEDRIHGECEMKARVLRLCAATMALGLAACGGSGDAPVDGAGTEAKWFTYERAEAYPGVARIGGLKITMADGIELSASVALPADESGNPVEQSFPVILTQTGYNKSIPAIPASNDFLVQRGYAHLSVDVRGTGLSQGQWEAFGEAEQADYLAVIDWASKQPWSNGVVGTWGASFMAITQLYTAAHQHPSHKAVFAIVPMADGYRDIVFTGGQTNIGFIPLWMGLVTGLGVLPVEPDPAAPVTIVEHLSSALLNFQVPVIAQSAIGVGGYNYDGPFWRTRSPIEQADRIRIPTFVVGGLNDIFQRGEPMLYEAIRRNTTAKLLIGPWQHLDGSQGAGLPLDGVPPLNNIALMWFDQYLKGMDVGAATVPNVTQYYYGAERYATARDWPHPAARAERLYLRGDRSLAAEPPAAGERGNVTLQQPLNGICSTSTSQWTAGLIGALPLPCLNSDNRLNELPLLEIAYSTPPMAEDYAFNGPIQADLYISTTALDAGVVVRVTDVAPDGSSRELTNGILTASLRAVDPARSRYLDGQMIQPWHPFTAESRESVGFNTVVHLPVEVFPTSAVIRQGHRLRVTVGASDFPHGLPPVVDLLDQLVGVMTVHSSAEHPSSIVLPVVPLAVTASE
jgi:uncharacterized protein